MEILFDILIVLFILVGAFIMKAEGFFKNVVNFILLYLASLLSSIFSTMLYNAFYKSLPFINLIGKSQGIKIINVFLWRSIFFILIFSLIVVLVRQILSKTHIDEKLEDDISTSGILSMVLSFIVSFASMVIIIFNLTIIFMFPMFGLKPLANSKVQNAIVKNIPILYKANANFYANEKYALNRLNKKYNTADNYINVSDDIIDNMVYTEFLTTDMIEYFEDNDMLLEHRKASTEKEYNDQTSNTDTTSNNDSYPDNATKEDEVDER